MVAAEAGGGHVADDMVDALGWESLAVVSRVCGLPGRVASGGAFGHRPGGTRRVGGGWDRGVGGVAVELLPQIADLGFQISDPLERRGQESTLCVALGTLDHRGFGTRAHGL